MLDRIRRTLRAARREWNADTRLRQELVRKIKDGKIHPLRIEGEHGPEVVRADPARGEKAGQVRTGDYASQFALGNLGKDPADLGREIVQAIKAYQHRQGQSSRWQG